MSNISTKLERLGLLTRETLQPNSKVPWNIYTTEDITSLALSLEKSNKPRKS
jgi:hypothetical protein